MDRAESFEQEAVPHLDAVYRFALRLTGSPADAEDLVQETFLRGYRAWDRYTPGTQAKSWLFTICRNAFLRQRQQEQRRTEITQQATAYHRDPSGAELELPLFVTVKDSSASSGLDAVVDVQILEAIERLPTEFRDVVVLSDLEQLAYAEVARVLDIPLGTVKSRLYRGRRLLQQQLHALARDFGYGAAQARPTT